MVRPISEATDLVELPHFSLVSGGLLFQVFRKTRLCGDALQFLHRRILILSCITWLPLLLLSAFEGNTPRGAIRVPFLYDIDAYVRFLIALPILVAAEVVVHNKLGPYLERFVTRSIVLERDLPAFRSAIASALRTRDSVALETGLIIYVFTAGYWIWRSRVALGEATWYGSLQGTHLHLTAAGYWYVFFSLPILQFVLARWYLRLFIWFQLLWRISRLNLQLDAAHPDRAGGINFLGRASYAFAPILIAQGAILAGTFADRVVLEGQPFLGFKGAAAGLTIFWVLTLLAPLCMFTPLLLSAKHAGQREYGQLASRYLAEFREKWILEAHAKGQDLLGSSDIQSLADMENTYDAVRRMRLVPFGPSEVTALAAVTMAPLLPLTLTVYSLDQLVARVLKMMF
jgi:hypothetical protein